MSLSAEDKSLLRQLFDEIDEDKSGQVDKSELRRFIQLLPGSHTDAEISEVYKGGDQDGSGCIEFDEFVSILTLVVKDMSPDEVTRAFKEAKDKSKEQMKSRRAMFESKGGADPPPPIRRAAPPKDDSPPPPPAPAVDVSRYTRELEDMKQQLEAARSRIRDLEAGQSRPCENCSRLRDELARSGSSADDRSRQLERELRELQEKHEKLRSQSEAERRGLREQIDLHRADAEHSRGELRTLEQMKCPQCLQAAKQQKLAAGVTYSPPVSPRGEHTTLTLAGVQVRKDRGWGALSGARRTTYCMGCGNPHRWAATPFVKENSNRPGMEPTEFYCRCCKKVNIREVRAEPPLPEQVRYPFTHGLYWYCSNCGGREPAGRPLGTTMGQTCSRCCKQATFEVREVPPARLIQMNKAAERSLYCRGCRDEECAMRWEPEGKEVELYCNRCRGVMAWEVRRKRV